MLKPVVEERLHGIQGSPQRGNMHIAELSDNIVCSSRCAFSRAVPPQHPNRDASNDDPIAHSPVHRYSAAEWHCSRPG